MVRRKVLDLTRARESWASLRDRDAHVAMVSNGLLSEKETVLPTTRTTNVFTTQEGTMSYKRNTKSVSNTVGISVCDRPGDVSAPL